MVIANVLQLVMYMQGLISVTHLQSFTYFGKSQESTNTSTILSMYSRFAPNSPLVMNFSIPITQGGRKGGLYINPCNHNNTSIPFPRLWSAVLSCLTSQWEKHSEDDPSDRCESWDARGFGRGDVFWEISHFLTKLPGDPALNVCFPFFNFCSK